MNTKKILWYCNRLKSMSMGEVVFRAKKAIVGQPKLDSGKLENLDHYLSFIDMNEIYNDFPFDEEARQQYIDFADKQINGLFKIFEESDIKINEINWQKDYQTGKESPLLPTSRLNYRDFKKIGNIKHIWELSRHQFLLPVAIAYYLTGKEEYKQYVLDVITDWIERNPYQVGINWSSCLELGVRLISWTFAISFLVSRGGELPGSFNSLIAKSIYTHAFHIHNNPSLFSSANNHLIGEIAGIFSASMLLRDHPDINEWLEVSKQRLIEQAAYQVYSDGVGAEQAPSYQAHTVGYYILCVYFLEKLGHDIPHDFLDLIKRSAEFYESIIDIHGEVPNIGDNDGGIPICLYARESFNEYRSMINTSYILAGESDVIPYPVDENNYWLFMSKVSSRSDNNMSEMKHNFELKKEFREGGYFLLGDHYGADNEVKIIFDCGPLGFLGIAAHGHADALSFVLNYGGDNFLIDPGTYKYFVDEEMRNYFRSTVAHNTIRVDKIDQSEMTGPFLWGFKADAQAGVYVSDEQFDSIEGSHNGYFRLKDRVSHKRKLAYDKKHRVLYVYDMLDMENMHVIEQMYHIDKRCEITGSENIYMLCVNDNAIRITLDEQLEWLLHSGQKNPMLGWQSEYFGDIAPCHTFMGSINSTSSVSLMTKIEIL